MVNVAEISLHCEHIKTLWSSRPLNSGLWEKLIEGEGMLFRGGGGKGYKEQKYCGATNQVMCSQLLVCFALILGKYCD